MPSAEVSSGRWMHRWAVLTVFATMPLLFLGAEVTTNKVGMVDQEWPTAPWLLWVKSWNDNGGLGFLIEHSHRLAGYTVGICAIVLAAGLWLTERRRWLCWLGTIALLGVVVQGVLGGMRVLLDRWLGPNLATMHGIFGQLVFSLLVAVALCTSRRWAEPEDTIAPEETASLRRCSLVVFMLLALQLILGACYRHGDDVTALVKMHMLTAFAVVAAVTWLVKLAHDPAGDARLRSTARLLAGVIAVQVMLGIEAYFVRRMAGQGKSEEWSLWRRDLVRSAHVLVGSFALATSVAAMLAAQRRTAWPAQVPSVAATHLEGAA